MTKGNGAPPRCKRRGFRACIHYDVFFEVLAEDPAVMQEMLCVILADPELTVISVTPQRDVANLMGRAVRLDAWCHLGDGRECDVEVQRADDDHVRRVRYNASGITWTKTNKGVNFEEIPDVCIVYISQFDFLGGGRTTYHVDKVIRETGVTVNDGLSEVYVNTKIDDGSDIANLMKCFLQEQVNNPKFPKLSARINELKNTEKGVSAVCTVMEEYQKDAVNKAIKETWEKAAVVVADETNKSNLNTVTENLRKRDPSLSVTEARKQAKALLGLED
ncbi:MAG: hypothetical protein PUE64_11840 [Firmicutes bacterium]|nr:hypothetical protein [Bacillota bacterium]